MYAALADRFLPWGEIKVLQRCHFVTIKIIQIILLDMFGSEHSLPLLCVIAIFKSTQVMKRKNAFLKVKDCKLFIKGY